MRASLIRNYKQGLGSLAVFLFAIVFLAACGAGGSGTTTIPVVTTTAGGANAGTSTSGTTGIGSTITDAVIPAAGVVLGSQPCPAAVSSASHWDPIVGTQPGISAVGRVTCANLIGKPTLQALILVGYDGTGHIIDVYVYDKITDPQPQQLFKLQGLYKGDTRISGYNTVLTAEVDNDSKINSGKPNIGLTLDLFREFKWSDGAGTFVQVAFPGLYPDLTRYQAEADQKQVSAGQDQWKLDPAKTTQKLAADLLKWSPSAPATIVSGGGKNDINAVVSVKSTNPGSGSIKATLSRLEGKVGNLWVVTAVTSAGMSITSPVSRDRLTSPVTVTGTGNAFEGKIGSVVVLDHLYGDIGHADANGATGNGNTTFSTSVAYTSSFKGGAQEGIVELYSLSNADGSIAGAVLVKEMLSA